MPLNKDVGNWIKDFMKSNAPQFKGKSKEERKDMALAAYREKYGSLNEQDDHVDPMVTKAYRDYIKAKKDSAADIDFAEDPGKAYRYYSKKLNNTYSTRADRDAVEAILKKKYGSAIEEEGATAAEEDKFHRELDKLVHKTFGHSSDEEKKMEEEAKPDFLDLDNDGDKKEPMKKAAKDKAVKKAMKKVSEIVKVKTPEEAAKVTKANPDAEVEVVSEVLTEGHGYDYEGKMAHSQLLSIAKNARDLFQMIDSDTQLKSWVQSKLTKAEDYLNSVRTYLEGESLTNTAPAMFENETIKDETGAALSIGDVVKGGDGRIYQVVYSYSEGKPMMVPFDLKRRKPLSLRDKVYFDSDSSIPKKLNKVMDYTATKGGFMK